MVHVVSRLSPAVQHPAHNPTLSRRTGASSGTAAASVAGGEENQAASDFRSLFATKTTSAAATPPPSQVPTPAPTAESVFGSNPWIANPTGVGPDGSVFSYNPIYFATAQTASTVAQMLGGKVVQGSQFTPNGGAFAQSQWNYMVELPNGGVVNPGVIASFYTHGYPQYYINGMIASEVQSAQGSQS